MHLLAEAHRAWERMRPLREKRERNKNFTYGNQWCDMMTDEHGRRVSEWQHLRDNGKDPLTNNLIRQLVKSVVGRFRSRLAAEPAPAEPLHGNLVGELDSRLMEEFLISGCCFQRIDFGEEGRVALSNVSPSQMLFRGGDDPRCRDFDLVGQLHDMPLATLVERLSDGSRTRALDICRHYQMTDEEIGAVLSFIKSTSTAQYDEEMIAEMERRAVAEKGSKKGGDDDGDGGGALDAMFEQAVECVIEAGQASTSLLQRRCKLGYARAARIMDQMEQEKIIGPYEGAKPRAVLVTKAEWEERKLNGQYDG